MGTRSILAEPFGDAWRGRYCHWDGYPAGNGAALWTLVKRDGVERVRTTLLHDRSGWSHLNPSATPEEYADQFAPGYSYSDGRFVVMDGYGVAYTTEQGQSSPDRWITHDGDKGWTEWCYVIADAGLLVGFVDDGGRNVTFLGMYRWDGPEPEWEAIRWAANTVPA